LLNKISGMHAGFHDEKSNWAMRNAIVLLRSINFREARVNSTMWDSGGPNCLRLATLQWRIAASGHPSVMLSMRYALNSAEQGKLIMLETGWPAASLQLDSRTSALPVRIRWIQRPYLPADRSLTDIL
jgi:hypothetical protein